MENGSFIHHPIPYLIPIFSRLSFISIFFHIFYDFKKKNQKNFRPLEFMMIDSLWQQSLHNSWNSHFKHMWWHDKYVVNNQILHKRTHFSIIPSFFIKKWFSKLSRYYVVTFVLKNGIKLSSSFNLELHIKDLERNFRLNANDNWNTITKCANVPSNLF